MNFSSSASSSRSDVGSFSTDFNNMVSEINSYWNGAAFISFSANMALVKSKITNVQQHFEIYAAVAELCAAIEVLDERIRKLEARRAVLKEPDPALEAEIERLKAEREEKVASAVSMLNGISNTGATDESLQAATTVLSSDVVGEAKSSVENSKSIIKLEPTCLEDIDLGPGKYMTDDDWINSPYINKEEFKCQCGGKYCDGYPVEISKTLVEDLNKIRFYYGSAVTINSGIRCVKHNANSGGASNSNHTKGRAADIVVEGVSASEVLAYIKSTYKHHNSDSYTGSDSGYAGMDGVVHFGIKDIDR